MVKSAQFSSDGQRVLTTSGDGTVRHFMHSRARGKSMAMQLMLCFAPVQIRLI
jgi:hypothetical protein